MKVLVLKNIKICISSTMVLIEMNRLLRYDHTTLYWVLSQFQFTQRDKDVALCPKKSVRPQKVTRFSCR